MNVGDLSVVVLPPADGESRLLGQLAEQSEGLTTAGGADQRCALQGATQRESVRVTESFETQVAKCTQTILHCAFMF